MAAIGLTLLGNLRQSFCAKAIDTCGVAIHPSVSVTGRTALLNPVLDWVVLRTLGHTFPFPVKGIVHGNGGGMSLTDQLIAAS